MSRINATVVFPDGQRKEYYFGAVPSIGNKITLGKWIDSEETNENGWPRQEFVETVYRVKDIRFALGEHSGSGYSEETTLIIDLRNDGQNIYIEPAAY